MPTKKERRRDPRVQVKWPVLIKGREGTREGELKDISLGGAFVRSDKPLNPKERSKLYIIVPDRKTFTVYFEVVWLRVDCSIGDIPPCGMGIRFTRVSRSERQYLTTIISNHYQKKISGGPYKEKGKPTTQPQFPFLINQISGPKVKFLTICVQFRAFSHYSRLHFSPDESLSAKSLRYF